MIAELARELDAAQQHRRAIEPVDCGTVAAGYLVQSELLALRTGRGERLVGVKLGFTSRAKQEQMGVRDVIVGRLTDTMQVADGGVVDRSALIHPRVQPEVVFRLADAVDDPDADDTDCVDAVAVGLEVIDSRYRDSRFDLARVVADNTSAAAFAVGRWYPYADVDAREVVLAVNGTPVERGDTSAILGDPINAVAALRAAAPAAGVALRPGQLVLAGAATAAVPLESGSVAATIAGLGSVTIRVDR